MWGHEANLTRNSIANYGTPKDLHYSTSSQ